MSVTTKEVAVHPVDSTDVALPGPMSADGVDNVYCKKDYHEFVENVKRFIVKDALFATSDLSPGAVADHFDVSRQFLDRVMKRYVQMTVYDFIIERRLGYSCYLLENTNDILYAIAINSGFGSERSFLRLFKHKFGLSPTMYRKVHRQKTQT